MKARIKAVSQGAFFGLLGFAFSILGAASSGRISGLPVSGALQLMERAAAGEGASVSSETARAAFEASHWYEHAVVPGLVGILCGLLAGFATGLRGLGAGTSGLTFALLSLLWWGASCLFDPGTLAGVFLFSFSLLGAATAARAMRQPFLSAGGLASSS